MSGDLAAVYLWQAAGDGAELRHSLRSLANLPHNGEVWLVGDQAPDWLTGVRHIEGNLAGVKARNVLDNIARAVVHPDVPDQFLLMNDDFFVMQPSDAPVEHCGTLAEHIARQKTQHGWYPATLRATLDYLQSLGIADPLSYELHKPMRVDKARMRQALAECAEFEQYDHPALQARSIYGNRWHIGGRRVADCKVTAVRTYNPRTVYSTNDRSFRVGAIGVHIRECLAEPSRYEADALVEA